MKKTSAFPSKPVISGILFLFIALIAVVWGCQKEEPAEKPIAAPTSTTNPDDGEGLTLRSNDPLYYDNVLNTAAVGLLQLSKNTAFRSLVNSKVAEQFDDDDNALLKTIAAEVQASLNLNLETEFANSINYHKNNLTVTSNPFTAYYQTLSIYTSTAEINNSINSFDNGGDILYPQIFIPYIEGVNLNSQPVIAILTKGEEEAVAYRLLTNGYFEVIKINEAFGQNNLVWVISPNESVNNVGILPNNENCCNPNGVKDGDETGVDCGGTCCAPCEEALVVGPCLPYKQVQVTHFKIYDNHEGGLNGRGEITWFGFQADDGCLFEMIGVRGAPKDGDPHQCDNWPTHYRKVANNEEGQWFTLDLSSMNTFSMATFAHTHTLPNESCSEYGNSANFRSTRLCKSTNDKFKFVMFERDHHNQRTFSVDSDDCTKNVDWKSADPAYLELEFEYGEVHNGENCSPIDDCDWKTTSLNGDDALLRIRTRQRAQ